MKKLASFILLILLDINVYAFTAPIDCTTQPNPGVNWTRCFKENAELNGANLESATLISTDFTDAFLIHANLRYVSASGALFKGAHMESIDLRYADLESAQMDPFIGTTYLSHANLMYANLSMADAGNTDFSYANLMYANLSMAELVSTDFSYANLMYANLSFASVGGHFDNANFTNAILEDARIDGYSFNSTLMVNADLKGAYFNGGVVTGSDGTNFESADLSYATFDIIRFNKSNFENANLKGIKITNGALIYYGDLRGADLTGARIDDINSQLFGSDISGATWINGNKCPNGTIVGPSFIGC